MPCGILGYLSHQQVWLLFPPYLWFYFLTAGEVKTTCYTSRSPGAQVSGLSKARAGQCHAFARGRFLPSGWQQFWSTALSYTHLRALPRLQGPLCSSSSPAQGPSLKLSPCPHLRRYLPGSPGALRVAEEWMGLCHRVVPSLACVPRGINAFPFLSSGSCSLQTPTGPTAWPWPSRTLCGGLGDTRELWSHCKYAPGLCATTQPRAGTAADKRLSAAWG